MRIYTPYDRNDLHIKRKDRVLEIGSGDSPIYRANVLVERFVNDNYHRTHDVRVFPHQILYNASGDALPFKNKEFDYVICNQVLEHVDDPLKFVSEITRVSSRGYIETPSLLGEFLFPKQSHKWIVLDIDDKLVMYEKEKLDLDYNHNYGELFLNYLPYQSLYYKLLWLTEGDMMLNRYEWKDNVDVIINPEGEYYKSFFTKPWTRSMVKAIFPERNFSKEFIKSLKAFFYLFKMEIRNKRLTKNRKALTLSEYLDLGKKLY